jgi:cyclophilin family peptidyl-prolyl cis-trans isomerase/HEAT repeat protein
MPAPRLAPLALIVAGLLPLLAGCGDDAGREARLEALARWEDRRLAPEDSLRALLEDPDAHVRLAAVRTAGLIGRHGVLQPMLDLLEDPSQTVRAAACWSLGILGDTLAAPALAAAAADERPAIRLAALRGLAQLPNRGEALLVAATGPDPAEAAAAFDALRNQAARVPRADLVAAIKAGLVSEAADVQWRALRCAELAADTSLVPVVVPFARSSQAQVRVHAYRALARLGGRKAAETVLAAAEDHRFRGRAQVRVDVAAARALAALAGELDEGRRLRLAALLIELAGQPHAHAAATALEAMAGVVADRPLPPEAAERESLLPVWRIRMARAAAGRLDHAEAMVRAAAAEAYAALRGRGALTELAGRLETETTAFAAAALARGVGEVSDDPLVELFPLFGRCALDTPAAGTPRSRWCGNATVVGAALTALAENRNTPPAQLRVHLMEFIMRAGAEGAPDHAKVLGAVAIDLAGRAPDPALARTAVRVAGGETGPWRADLVLGVLDCLTRMSDADSTLGRDERTAPPVRDFASRALDDPDVRIRLAARELVTTAGLLEPALVPSEASLRATLPGFVRDPGQPPVTLPFPAVKVRGTTPRGDFEITLMPDLAPNTCAAFLDLVAAGFYDGLVFHRVVPDFVVQGGDPTGTGWGGPGYTIRSEWSAAPYKRGTVGIAHSGKDTGGSQWFVTLSEQPHLVGRYTVFGEVTGGLEVFDAMNPGDVFTLETIP